MIAHTRVSVGRETLDHMVDRWIHNVITIRWDEKLANTQFEFQHISCFSTQISANVVSDRSGLTRERTAEQIDRFVHTRSILIMIKFYYFSLFYLISDISIKLILNSKPTELPSQTIQILKKRKEKRTVSFESHKN